MTFIDQNVLAEINPDTFGPQNLAEELGFLPEIFPFLKNKEDLLGRTRPAITFVVAATIRAFRKRCGQPARSLPAGFMDRIWDRWAQGDHEDRIVDLLEALEPHLWSYFLHMAQSAVENEDWSQQDVAVASLVFATILFASIFQFWPEDYLPELEQALRDHGVTALHDM
jgi:hypothetical protein